MERETTAHMEARPKQKEIPVKNKGERTGSSSACDRVLWWEPADAKVERKRGRGVEATGEGHRQKKTLKPYH